MSNDREFGIPDDHVVIGPVPAAASAQGPPDQWDLVMYRIAEVHAKGITGKGVRVSVHDTGYDPSHPDIPQAVAEKSYYGSIRDGNGHGQWCVSKVHYVAPGAELMVAKVLSDRGSGSTNYINDARRWAADNGADVISESLGGPQGDPRDVESIVYAYENGVQLDVAAAGNSGYRGSGNTIGYPGRYFEPGTYCVGSHDSNRDISTFSSGGREIDVATPGENTVGARPGSGYTRMSGTSMATPFFAGLMALIIQKRRESGLNDLHGDAAWREFFAQEGFFDDRGPDGHDPRYGRGLPLIHNILDWLLDTEWV